MNLDSLRQDFRQALRRDRAFAFGSIAIPARGIGANTAVFRSSIACSCGLSPTGNPDRLFVYEVIPQIAQFGSYLPVNPWHFREWKNRCSCFEDAVLAHGEHVNVFCRRAAANFGSKGTSNFFSLTFAVHGQIGVFSGG
jgi:hypothetical protein